MRGRSWAFERLTGKKIVVGRASDPVTSVLTMASHTNPTRKGRVRRRREERNLMQHRFFVKTPARRIALFLIFALSLSSFALSSFGAFAQDEKQDKKRDKQRDEK